MRKMGWALFTAVIVADAALTACGGDASSNAAGAQGGGCAISGCGGDIEGTWVITSMCGKTMGSPMTSVPQCDAVAADALAGATIDANGATLDFSNGTYTQAGTVHLGLHYKYTNECLTVNRGDPASDATCAMVQSNLVSAGFPGKCRFSGDTCLCDVTQDLGVDASGTYRVDGTKLVFDGDKTGSPFCVMGDEGHVSTPPGSPVSGSIAISRR